VSSTICSNLLKPLKPFDPSAAVKGHISSLFKGLPAYWREPNPNIEGAFMPSEKVYQLTGILEKKGQDFSFELLSQELKVELRKIMKTKQGDNFFTIINTFGELRNDTESFDFAVDNLNDYMDAY